MGFRQRAYDNDVRLIVDAAEDYRFQDALDELTVSKDKKKFTKSGDQMAATLQMYRHDRMSLPALYSGWR